MMTQHECIHEDLINEQFRITERMNAELDYKKERLDDLKEDNKRMEKKIDSISKNLDGFIHKSDEKDAVLDNRLTIIETRLDANEKATSQNRESIKLGIAIIGVVITVITFYFTFMR